MISELVMLHCMESIFKDVAVFFFSNAQFSTKDYEAHKETEKHDPFKGRK